MRPRIVEVRTMDELRKYVADRRAKWLQGVGIALKPRGFFPLRKTDDFADVVWWARGVLVGGILAGILIALLLSLNARGAPVVSLQGAVQDPNADPLHVTVTWTLLGGIPGPGNSTCNATALLVQRSADDGPWGAEPDGNGRDRRIIVPLNATSGTFPEELARGHLWRVRVLPEFPAICQGSGGETPEPSNALEYDLRNHGFLGWNTCCGLVVGAVFLPVGVVYAGQRRKRRTSACPSCDGTGRIPAGSELKGQDPCLRCGGTGKVREA